MDATPLPIAEADLKTLVGTMRDMPRDSVDLDVVSSAVCRFGLHPVQATVNELVFGLGRSQQRMSRVLYAHLSMVVMYFRRSRHHSSVRDGCDLFEQLITQYLVMQQAAFWCFECSSSTQPKCDCCVCRLTSPLFWPLFPRVTLAWCSTVGAGWLIASSLSLW